MTEDEMHAEVMAEFAKVRASLDELLHGTAELGDGLTAGTGRLMDGQDKILDTLNEILERIPADWSAQRPSV